MEEDEEGVDEEEDEEARMETPATNSSATAFFPENDSALAAEMPPHSQTDLHKHNERTPLLHRAATSRSKSRRRRTLSEGPHGDATVLQAVLMVR